ncbi:MAG: phosphoenolpyruvate synthase [Bacteroidales bacterium]|nr:phosphoenolpyruvate synthase [Bacteroidales bacterium]
MSKDNNQIQTNNSECADNHGIIESYGFDFSDTSFDLLMQTRIHKVLLVCSNYDAFMLEEDGRIDEQIFIEYVSLNLRYPPVFIQVDNIEEAFHRLENEKIDLVITMWGKGEMDTFELSRQIKREYINIPIVILAYFSREVSVQIKKSDLSAIDYVFSWLGNANLLLAIIKLIEDKMNAEYDILQIGVQSIILVENSIRFVSSYLPNLYTIILNQSKEFQQEALNEHQIMMRMRGRPKILLATNFEEAVELYEKYKENVLGIISDITFNRKGIRDVEAGIKLCKLVKKDNVNMPFVLQSSDNKYKRIAIEMNVDFLYKYSKNLSIELRDFIIHNLAFGSFIFRDPDTKKEIARAANLQEFQQILMSIPDQCLEYHTSRDHFSKWLNARALFPIAQMFKYLHTDDFGSLDGIRKFLDVSISCFRLGKGRGVIAKFERTTYDKYSVFSRVGDGSIGGKARGLAFVNSLIKDKKLFSKYEDVVITIPRTVVLCTDVFDEFMENNDLYKIGLSDLDDNDILQAFTKAKLPGWIYLDIKAFLKVSGDIPIAVRSSSKLEDSHYQPFAGIYSTYMIPPHHDKKVMLAKLADAIKQVYASVYFKSSKAYMTATSNVIDEEKMGIILQEVCGSQYNNRFYPTISGVARSLNFYPIGPEKSEDGIANVAMGLGKLVVDGGATLRFSPKYPRKILQLSTPELALRESQKNYYALDMNINSFVPSVDDGINILSLPIREAKNDNTLKWVASTFDFENNILRNGYYGSGNPVITFSNILEHNAFPLAEILRDLLEIGQNQMNNPIEIEFAVNIDTPEGYPKEFNFLQIRPVVNEEQFESISLDDVKSEDTLIISDSALGNGVLNGIRDLVYVKPDAFDASFNEKIAGDIEKLNTKFASEGKNYILTGPGRWGSTDYWLGIPTKWAQISQARVIVESGLDNYRIDPSQGTHFFQNLTSFRVGYFTINPFMNDGYYDIKFLDNMEATYEDDFIRHIRFSEPLLVVIDGKTRKGVIYKPGKGNINN